MESSCSNQQLTYNYRIHKPYLIIYQQSTNNQASIKCYSKVPWNIAKYSFLYIVHITCRIWMCAPNLFSYHAVLLTNVLSSQLPIINTLHQHSSNIWDLTSVTHNQYPTNLFNLPPAINNQHLAQTLLQHMLSPSSNQQWTSFQSTLNTDIIPTYGIPIQQSTMNILSRFNIQPAVIMQRLQQMESSPSY